MRLFGIPITPRQLHFAAGDLLVVVLAVLAARAFLPVEAGCPVFVNADLIAAGLAPFAPESAAVQAGRLMLKELGRHFAARVSFAFETTLAGRGYVQHIRAWQAAGYRVKLIFLQLDSPEEAIARVAQRVRVAPVDDRPHDRNAHPGELPRGAGVTLRGVTGSRGRSGEQ